MHYRLRPIKRGQFRFANFASHFISVQIFQIDFSALSLIFFCIQIFQIDFRGRNEHSSIYISHYHAIDTFVNQQKGTS